MSVSLTGNCCHYNDFASGAAEPEEGDLLLKPGTDAAGRAAMAGGHTNFGFSGYFTAFLFADGDSRRLLNYKELWPKEENRFAARQDIFTTMARVEASLVSQAGRLAVKVKGGWELQLPDIDGA